jgi:hypothetical protein
MNRLYIFLLAGLLLSCKKSRRIDHSGEFEIGKPLAEIEDKRLEELSGISESIRNPGYLWVENDGGNDAKIFLINKKANIKLTCTLKGIKNRDWEDIAVGPGPEEGKTYIYIAEIGDNNAVYPLKYIYRFEEPVLGADKKIEITRIDTITFKLSDSQKDTETLLLDPLTKDLYLLSKREEPVHLYQLKYPYSTTDTLTAESVLSLPLTQLTGGDISSDGKEIVIKNYDDIFYYKREEGKDLTEALKQKPVVLAYEPEPQGEAIAWARDGSGFYTASETITGETSFLLFYKRK